MKIAILTAPRAENHLPGLLAMLPLPMVTVYCDGIDFPPEMWGAACVRVRERNDPPNNKYAGWLALRDADDDLLFLEDDVRPMDLDRMLTHAPKADFVSFFWPGGSRSVGIYPASQFAFSQALLIPRITCERLAAREPPEHVFGFDFALNNVARDLGMRFEQTENLVHHIGRISAARPGQIANH